MTTLIIIIALVVIAMILGMIYVPLRPDYTMFIQNKPFYLLPTDDPKWKRVVHLEYIDNILTVKTFDHNIRQFYHAINDPTDHTWKRYPSRTIIKDNTLIQALNQCYSIVLNGDKIPNLRGGGWVKSLW